MGEQSISVQIKHVSRLKRWKVDELIIGMREKNGVVDEYSWQVWNFNLVLIFQ